MQAPVAPSHRDHICRGSGPGSRAPQGEAIQCQQASLVRPRPKAAGDPLEVVSSVPQQTTIVAALPLEGTKTERARRKALEEIVRRLIDMSVCKLVLESRNDTHDKRDRELLVSMRRKGEALNFDLEHVPGKDEPLLWVPDQILGAYGEVITKGASRKWEDSWRRVERTLDVREVPTR